MDLRQYAKAVVPVLVSVIILGLSHLGIGPQTSVQDAINLLIGGLVTSGAVWAVPNKQA